MAQTPGHALELVEVLRLLPDPVVIVDSDVRVRWANDVALEGVGCTLAELQTMTAVDLIHPDDLVTALASHTSVAAKDVGTLIELRLRSHDGTYHRHEVRGRSLDLGGGEQGVVMVLRDVSDRGSWEVGSGDADLLRAIVDDAPMITLLLDPEGRVVGASRALSRTLGVAIEDVRGRPLSELLDPATVMALDAELTLAASSPGARTFEVAVPHADGDRVVMLSVTVANLLDDRSVNGLVLNALDISELVEARQRLERMATRDPLTNLPNRHLLMDRAAEAMARAATTGVTVGLLYCDLDDFKEVNDRLGHRCGDHVLIEAARRLLAAVREDDLVARIGGDEFVVLIERGAGALAAIEDRIRREMAAPVRLPDGQVVRLRVSLGSATHQGLGGIDELLSAADEAMYRAKRRRSAWRLDADRP